MQVILDYYGWQKVVELEGKPLPPTIRMADDFKRNKPCVSFDNAAFGGFPVVDFFLTYHQNSAIPIYKAVR